MIAKAKATGKYIWGETEGGGTTVIYVSDTPFSKLMFPKKVPNSWIWLREKIVKPLGWGFLGLTVLGLLGHLIYWRSKRETEKKSEGD